MSSNKRMRTATAMSLICLGYLVILTGGDAQPSPPPTVPTVGQSASSITTEVQAAASARAILAQQYRSAPNGWGLLGRIGGPWRLGNWASPDVSRHLCRHLLSGRPDYDGLAWFVHFMPPVRPALPLTSGLYQRSDAHSANREDFTMIIGDQGQSLGIIIDID